jgi:hypothetical protein
MKNNGARNAFDMSNQTDISNIQVLELSSLSTHLDQANPGAHQVGNIDGLQTALDGKQDSLTGFTGDVVIIIGIDFVLKTTTTQTLTYVNGVLAGVA